MQAIIGDGFALPGEVKLKFRQDFDPNSKAMGWGGWGEGHVDPTLRAAGFQLSVTILDVKLDEHEYLIIYQTIDLLKSWIQIMKINFNGSWLRTDIPFVSWTKKNLESKLLSVKEEAQAQKLWHLINDILQDRGPAVDKTPQNQIWLSGKEFWTVTRTTAH